jgi:hypothetical protein
MGLLSLVLLAATIGGCERGDVLAPSDGSIILTANPSNVTLDQNNPDNFALVEITAQVFEAGGFTASNVTLAFTTTGGQLASGGAELRTDENGVATDTLTIRPGDPDAVTVTVRSGVLTQSVTVTVNCPDNPAPIAVIVPSGPTALVGPPSSTVTITLDGSSSSDGDGIAEYAWSCGNGQIIASQPQAICSYTVDSVSGTVDTYTASLIVTDGRAAPCEESSTQVSITITVTAQ